jgi:TRAP transporter 4TM/12TM fusion protein
MAQANIGEPVVPPAEKDTSVEESFKTALGRYDYLPRPFKVIFIALVLVTIGLFTYNVFGWNFFGITIGETPYYYILYIVMLLPVFLVVPMRAKDRNRLPWYDVVFGLVTSGLSLYFLLNLKAIEAGSWHSPPNALVLGAATIMCILALESGRRIGKLPFLIICLIFGSYPLFAEQMPGVFYGISVTFPELMSKFAFSTIGILGIPAQVNGEILIGYLVFAGVMLASGAGRFFLDAALAVMGHFRGGPAKVAVISSALFGSLSGSAVSNVVATGSITIPAMKKLGYPGHYAGAIEACASTGGTIMPPVMGTIAFIMAAITDIEYSTIVVAAAIPAILYYFGLLVQVDGYAARNSLRGIPRDQLPSLRKALKTGWPFLFAFAALVVFLVYFHYGHRSPLMASAIMIGLSFINKETRLNLKRLEGLIASVGTLIMWTVAILLPVGLIVAGLTVTGTAANLVNAVVNLGQGNLILILLITAVACYLMGMIGMSLVPYLFMAVIMAPSVIKIGGLDPLAVHLFLVYYVIMTGITPPVAIVAFVSASLAGATPMKTAWTSLRLGIVLVFIPFFFVFNPALVMNGPPLEIITLFAFCLLGIWILTSGLEGYLLKIGRLGLWERPSLVVAGFLIALPGWIYTIAGTALTALVIAIILIRKKAQAGKVVASD